MKITPKILSIPPYLSTTWKNISTIHVREEAEGFLLIVILQNRVQVEVPGLDKETVDAVFEAHAKYAESEVSLPKNPLSNPLDGPFSFSLPLRSDGQMIDSLGSSMQHSPDQADLPPLPPEVLEKITTVARAFGLEDASSLQNPEPNCNCIYCQVVRSLKGEEKEPAEEIGDADLRFRDWDIVQTADKLYLVANPLDKNEHYNVYLGDPLGCTCGSKNCEHIRAVLNT
jgi:hypothetical protein